MSESEQRHHAGRSASSDPGAGNDRLPDELLAQSRDQAGGLRLTGEGSMLGDLVKAVLERALEAELTAHLTYDKHHTDGCGTGNSRNGKIAKTVQTGVGSVRLAVPRDRAGTFEPVLVPKRAGRCRATWTKQPAARPAQAPRRRRR
ncbi:transposase [Spirillospora sp. NPDC050365]